MYGADKKGRLIAKLVISENKNCDTPDSTCVSKTYVSIPDSSREFSITKTHS